MADLAGNAPIWWMRSKPQFELCSEFVFPKGGFLTRLFLRLSDEGDFIATTGPAQQVDIRQFGIVDPSHRGLFVWETKKELMRYKGQEGRNCKIDPLRIC